MVFRLPQCRVQPTLVNRILNRMADTLDNMDLLPLRPCLLSLHRPFLTFVVQRKSSLCTPWLMRLHMSSILEKLNIILVAGPPLRPPSEQQYYGPKFQNSNQQQVQPSFQYSQCNGKKKALCVRYMQLFYTSLA